jgi:hypothetical protein
MEFDVRGCFVGLYMKWLFHHAVVKWLDKRDIVIEIRKLLCRPGGKLFVKHAGILTSNAKRNEGSGCAQNSTA